MSESGQVGGAGWARAQAAVADAIRLLERPDTANLDRSTLLLAEAAAGLETAGLEAPPGELAEWQRKLYHLRRLHQAAGEYYDGWASRLGTLTRGYTAAGTPASLEAGRRWLAQG